MNFRHLPVQRKLMSIIVGTSVLVLVLTGVTFFSYEFFAFRRESLQQLVTLGNVIAANSTAGLAFDNADDAAEVLAALKAEPEIRAAALYDRQGRLFARYPADLPPAALPPTPRESGYRFAAGGLEGFAPVVQVRGARRLGTLYLRSDLSGMHARLRLYALIAAGITAALSIVAYAISRTLQRQISTPILALVETAKAVSNRRDYSVRASRLGDDELGLLTDAFNHMLQQIEQQNRALQRAYDDLRQAQDRMLQQERLRALGQMASGVAHDISNAISPASLYVDSVLARDPSLAPRSREYLTIVQRAIDDVAQTVARLREFYRDRKAEIALLPVDPNALLRQVADLTRAQWGEVARQRRVTIELRLELAADLPALNCVDSEIREALTNLVFNAADALPQGGVITMGSQLVADAAGRRLCLFVADNGVGMDEDTRRLCLEPFFTTKGERGTGLGLAMVYGTTRRHGAEIEIVSAPGAGTTVRLLFPLPMAPAADATASSSARRLLIVDDDVIFLRSFATALEGEGHEVTAVDSGGAAVEALQASPAAYYDAVFTDLDMPDVDGRAVARAVRARSPRTVVFLLSGWAQKLRSEGDLPYGVAALVDKPPKLALLRELLAQLRPPVV